MFTNNSALPIRQVPVLIVGGFAALLLSACATYRPLPLKQASERAEAPANWNSLRKAALHLNHPLLKPIVINGRHGFSPDEIAVIAAVANPSLRALRDQRGIAQAQVIQAGILPNPQIGFSLDKPRGNSDPTLVTGRSLGIDWNVMSLLTRGNDVQSARAAAKAVDLQVAWLEWQTAQAARLDAFRILSLQRQITLATAMEHSLEHTARLLTVASRHRLALAAAAASAVDSAESARSERLNLEQALRTTQSNLDLALGLPVNTHLPLKPSPAFPSFQDPRLRLHALLRNLEKRRLDLLALQAGYASQNAALRAEIKRQFPRFSIGLHQGRDTSNIKSVGFGISLELPLFDRNQAGVAAAKATRQELFDEYSARVSQARSEVALIYGDLASTRIRLRELKASLPRYSELAAAAEQAERLHQIDATSADSAITLLASHRLEVERMQESRIELAVALETLSARPLLNREP